MLEWFEYGDPDGTPVLLQPGTPATGQLGALADAAARRSGVRLIAVSRPGYGASTPTAPGLVPVAAPVAALTDELGVERVAAWSWSGGGPFALAQAVVTPERVSRVVVAAGPAPGWPPEDEADLVAEATSWGRAFAEMDDDTMSVAMAEGAPPNEHYFEDHPAGRPTFLADFRRALARPDGYVRDNLTWEGDWEISLAEVRVPVDLVYGETDQMVTIDHGERLATAIPHAQLHALPGAAHGDTTFGAVDLVLRLLTTPL